MFLSLPLSPLKFYARQNVIIHSFSYIIDISLGKALDSIFKKPESIFVKTTVRDLFFHGIPFDCTDVTDFAGSAVCSALKERDHILIQEGGLRYRFGYLAKVMHLQIMTLCRYIFILSMKEKNTLLASKILSFITEVFK